MNDEVYTRCIFYKTAGDIFVADLYAHNNYMKKYVKRYVDGLHRAIQTKENIEDEEAHGSAIQHGIDNL